MSAPRPNGQKNAAEYVCLTCPLPECDETDAGCLYRQQRPRQNLKELLRNQGRTCPYPGCNTRILNGSRTCGQHRWYR